MSNNQSFANKSMKILDCTLRDGGYINNWEFSNEISLNIVDSLVDAEIEIIECGFISQKNGCAKDSSLYKNIEQVNKLFANRRYDKENHMFCVMANLGEYDFSTLPECNHDKDHITAIRLAFHRKNLTEAFDAAKTIISKGYKIFIQGMVTLSYSDTEIITMIDKFNQLNIYALYIVDSFGAMFGSDFRRLHYIFDHNLRSGIILGYHTHNNLQLAYSNAIDFLRIKNIKRNIIIDSSIFGIGRGAGNLNTELFADYLNKNLNKNYNITPLLQSIDNYLEAIYRENYWGYSIGHFLSASINCHPNYASFLLSKKRMTVTDIQQILARIEISKRKNYYKDYIQELYLEYNSERHIETNIPNDFFDEKNILILASGPSTKYNKKEVCEFIEKNDSYIVIVNHCTIRYTPDLYFFSNQKRYNKFGKQLISENLIVTSNIKLLKNHRNCFVVDYSHLANMTEIKSDNVSVLLLNLLINHDVAKVAIAGLDGYKINEMDNYSYAEKDSFVNRKQMKQQNETIGQAIKEISKHIIVNFVTSSIFEIAHLK